MRKRRESGRRESGRKMRVSGRRESGRKMRVSGRRESGRKRRVSGRSESGRGCMQLAQLTASEDAKSHVGKHHKRDQVVFIEAAKRWSELRRLTRPPPGPD